MAMNTAPAVRARHLQTILARVDRLDDAARDRVRAAVGATALATIHDALGIAWLPAELDLAVTGAVYRALGQRRAAALWKEVVLEAFGTPVFRTLIDGARLLFGHGPAALMRWVPQGWGVVFRGCGAWTVKLDGPDRALLRCVGVPAAAVADPAWQTAVGSALQALLEVSKTPGTVTVGAVDAAAGALEYVVSWAPKAARP